MEFSDRAKEKGEKAEELFRSGHGCCQSVLLAFEKESGLTKEQLIKLGSPFGGGIGRMRSVCGASMGAFMLAGLIKGGGDRAADYELVRKIAADSESANGSFICAELLKGVKTTPGAEPEKRDENYYKRRPCPALCRIAAQIAAKRLLDE